MEPLLPIRYILGMLKAYFSEFQEHIGLQWNKSGNYWSFPSNKESQPGKLHGITMLEFNIQLRFYTPQDILNGVVCGIFTWLKI